MPTHPPLETATVNRGSHESFKDGHREWGLAMSDRARLGSAEAQGATGIRTLVLAGVALSCFWGMVLPAIGRVPFIRADIERLDAAGIDASALYWTDLEDKRLWSRTELEPVDQAVAPLSSEVIH